MTAENRADLLQRLSRNPFDLLVIGGGITGAGIARDASLRGLSVALLEKGRFGSGTSSKSSKLIHGGIRYLEQFQFGLVRESCKERGILLRNDPDLVWPLAFVLPVYRGAKRGRAKLKAGLWLYDLISIPRETKKHQSLKTEDVLNFFPNLRKESLLGGFVYFDAQTDDVALTRAIVESAVRSGCVAAEQTEVTGFEKENGKIRAAAVRDISSGQSLSIRARKIVNATGPWVDAICRLDEPDAAKKLRPTKGVHVVFERKRFPAESGLLLFAPQDGRVFFVLPWKGKTLVGTTDTDDACAPDQTRAEEPDLLYLLEAVSSYFPQLSLQRSDIVDSFAGLRPLLRQDQGGASQVSREHHLFESSSGLLTIAGGKLTTYRRMAEQVTDRVVRLLKAERLGKKLLSCQTDEIPICPESQGK